jgi:deoxycytidine triphosphate deaminase
MDQKMALEHRMIEPFEEGQIRNGVISYGTSSYGYDIPRCGRVQDFHEYQFGYRGSEEL